MANHKVPPTGANKSGDNTSQIITGKQPIMATRNCNHWIAIAVVTAILGLAGWSGVNAQVQSGSVLAVVNDVAITQHDLSVEAAHLNAELEFRNQPLDDGQLSQLRNQLVENLIDRELLYQQAQQRKIRIQKRWVDLELKKLKYQLGNRAAYRRFLENTGMTERSLRARIEKGLIVRRLLRREVIRQIKVSQAEMLAFYHEQPGYFQRNERIRTRHILIAFNDKSDKVERGNALLRIQSIQLMLHENTDFASLALEHSDDPSNVRGGDIGYLERQQLTNDFAKAAFALEPGQVSDIVETRFGFHLIKMIDRIPPSRMTYRSARAKIERTLRRNKEKKATDVYLARQRRRASISRP
jgi:parvulin-like peptidyl-prolyl isomerase